MRKTVPLSSVVPVLRSPASSSPLLSTGKPWLVHTTQEVAPGRDDTGFFAISSILMIARPDLSCPVTTRRICKLIPSLLVGSTVGNNRETALRLSPGGWSQQSMHDGDWPTRPVIWPLEVYRVTECRKYATIAIMQLRIRSITHLAEAINGFELVDPRGRDLPRFEAGAHIDLRIGSYSREYSLWNSPVERRRYCIAVLREPDGRGGSCHLHDNARVGDFVEVSVPRNNFPLDQTAERHLLIAGGIGIAPIMSMISELQRC